MLSYIRVALGMVSVHSSKTPTKAMLYQAFFPLHVFCVHTIDSSFVLLEIPVALNTHISMCRCVSCAFPLARLVLFVCFVLFQLTCIYFSYDILFYDYSVYYCLFIS